MTRALAHLELFGRGAKRFVVALLIPLSLIPLAIIGERSVSELGAILARHTPDRSSLPAPPVHFTPAQRAEFTTLPAYRHAVPVLTYHGINGKHDTYSIDQRQFAQQMAMLKHAGFTAISIAQFERMRHGVTAGIPARPILITFDDGRFDSVQGADQVLKKYGMRATMFVISGWVGRYRFYSSWHELRQMRASGRWDLQEHAGYGHYEIPFDAHGHVGSYYTYRKWISKSKGQAAHLESYPAWKARVTKDLTWGRQELDKQTGAKTFAYASPYGNIGQKHTNDRRIPGFLSHWLAAHYGAVFVADWPHYITRTTPHGHMARFEVHQNTTPEGLYRWLRVNHPSCHGRRCLR